MKCFIVLMAHRQTAINGCHRDMGHQSKKRRRVSSLINSGGQAFMMMLIEQFKVADDVNPMGERRRKLPWYQ